MKKLFPWIFLALLAGGFSNCRSTKKIQTAITKKDTAQVVPLVDNRADSIRFMKYVYRAIQANRIDFETLAAKIKVDFVDKDGKKNDFNAFIRLRKDSALWVSINAALGIEAFRVLITPDSVRVLNKLDKIYQVRSVSYLQEVAHIPLTFQSLQDLLIGNPVYLDSNIVSYKKEENGNISLVSIGSIFKNLLTVSSEGYEMLNSKLDDLDVLRARTCFIVYGDYEKKNGVNFSSFRKITVSERSRLDIEMQFKQFTFNEDLSFPFNVPKNYKR